MLRTTTLRSLIAALVAIAVVSTCAAQTLSPIVAAPANLSQNATTTFTPSQIRKAYGIDSIKGGQGGNVVGDGSGQTIAIISAFHYSNALSDLNTFSSQWGLPEFNVAGGPTFTQPCTANSDPIGTWAVEAAMDIQWAHAIAPKANIALVEAVDDGVDSLYAAIDIARGMSGVSVVSMSWGLGEYAGQTVDDEHFTTPSHRFALHQGVTFVASAGDSGAPGSYPAFSPNVVAVGGTVLTLNNDGSRQNETGWSGSGGSISTQEPKPIYQTEVDSLRNITNRAMPDVSMAVGPVYVYDTDPYYDITRTWWQIGGTSLSTPCWAGLFAIANQLRESEGLGSLDGATQTLPALYSLPASDFYDITSGSNGSYFACSGYDMVTGLGSPTAETLVPHLAAYGVPEPSPLTLLTAAAVGLLGYIWQRSRWPTCNGKTTRRPSHLKHSDKSS